MKKISKSGRVLGIPHLPIPEIETHQATYKRKRRHYIVLKYVVAVMMLSCQLTMAVLAIGYPALNFVVGGLGSCNALFTVFNGYASCDIQIAKYTTILDKLATLYDNAVHLTSNQVTAELNVILQRKSPYMSEYIRDKDENLDERLIYSLQSAFSDGSGE